MHEIAPGWLIYCEACGNWMCVELHTPSEMFYDSPALADGVWHVLEERAVAQLVLDLRRVERLSSWLIGQLVLLHRRLTTHGGHMLVCGLSEGNRAVLRMMGLAERFSHYESRHEALAAVAATA